MAWLKTSVIWLIYFARGVLGRRRFFGPTPPFLKLQRVYDRRSKQWLRFRIRDDDDWIQIEHIFLNEGFDLTNSGQLPQMQAAYQARVAAGRTPLIVDLGANIGLASAYFHQLYPQAQIIAVEPDAGNCAIARANLPPKAELVEAAISSRGGRANLLATGRNCGFQVQPGADGAVEMVTVPDLLAQAPDAEPFLIKIDIEGFEDDLFAENVDWLDQFPILLIELHDWMLPGRLVTRNFLKAISTRDRDFVHFEGFALSIATRLQ